MYIKFGEANKKKGKKEEEDILAAQESWATAFGSLGADIAPFKQFYFIFFLFIKYEPDNPDLTNKQTNASLFFQRLPVEI